MMRILFVFVFLYAGLQTALSQTGAGQNIPFSTNDSALTVWNGSDYIPVFLKGVNLGVAVPGTFPGEMAATRADYSRWFTQIKDAGFNCIRLYTLHYPRFYEVLDSFNTANPHSPLYFLQGIWLEEEMPGYRHNLYSMTDSFRKEIEDNIDCIHGNKLIAPRQGKAHGSFGTDASAWCLAFIVGREVHPVEVWTTNDSNSAITSFSGSHFSIQNATPAEAWFTGMLDHTVAYQKDRYQTQRPVSNSSWPTLDPMVHPEEPNIGEDTAFIDLSKVQIVDAPAGFFISYHAYPYYPDFVSEQTSYQGYSDEYGRNSYLGYLAELKSHYAHYPLIIAEYGVPSSWAVAHYASSGMNHGGFDEYNQGLTNIRLLESIRATGAGGGIQFAWIDEWFKKTWITDPLDYIADSRILKSNVAAAEQNYGLISYRYTHSHDILIPENTAEKITYLHSEVNSSYLEFEIGLKDPLAIPDELWVTLDTYDDSLGESILPTGDTIPSRSEFVLHITNYSAELLVTEAYDVFGIWHGYSKPEQLFHSIPTDGKPWKIVRVRNNSSFSDVQYIGNLQVNHSFQPPSSKDAVTISDDKIRIRLPWFYINFVAPDKMRVFNDDRSLPEKQDTTSDGVAVSILYSDQWYSHSNRLTWPHWSTIPDSMLTQEFKQSYYVMKDNLHKFNTPAIAVRDSFYFPGTVFPVNVMAEDGLLANDFDLDGKQMVSLILINARNGAVAMNNDGSFDYLPNTGFTGYDSFQYCIYDGHALSTPNTAVVFVEPGNPVFEVLSSDPGLLLYPNPATSILRIRYPSQMRSVQVFSLNGQLVEELAVNATVFDLKTTGYVKGEYVVVVQTDKGFVSERFVKH